MDVERYTKLLYDKFGKEYMKSREEKSPDRAYNECLEMPAMLKALGNIKGKKILDIGCGAGVHIKKYLKKGACCYGIDVSKTMVEMARKNCPQTEFEIGSMYTLPYKDKSFDIVTASLSINYLKDLDKVFKEVSRVLKKGGMFFYSNESPISAAREYYEDSDLRALATGVIKLKKSNKIINLGKAWSEGVQEWQMLPRMIIKFYQKTFRTQLLALRNAGFELADLIDLKAGAEFKRRNKEKYDAFSKFPFFSIYVAKKK